MPQHWTVAILAIGLPLLCAGCGGGASEPPPEAPPAEVVISPESGGAKAAPAEFSGGGGEAAPRYEGPGPETPAYDAKATTGTATVATCRGATARSTMALPQIRLYLAQHDIYRPWYPEVGRIRLAPGGATEVGTTLPEQARGQARQVCMAVAASPLVDQARVAYGTESTIACR